MAIRERINRLQRAMRKNMFCFWKKNKTVAAIPREDILDVIVDSIEATAHQTINKNPHVDKILEAEPGQAPPMELLRSMAEVTNRRKQTES